MGGQYRMGRCLVYQMTVEAFIICWNREDTIHLTIKHYLKLGRVILYDNFSDDRTREIAESLGAEVRMFGVAGQLDDQAYIDVKNHCWKHSQADYVIVVDEDEILYHPHLDLFLANALDNGCTILRPQGFNIHSDEMPVSDWLEIKRGENNENYSKSCVFRPLHIKEIGYRWGCHACRPMGNIVYGPAGLHLLHYRDVGGVDRLIERHRLYQGRLSEFNKKFNLGHHYSETEADKRKQWKDFSERSVILSEAGLL